MIFKMILESEKYKNYKEELVQKGENLKFTFDYSDEMDDDKLFQNILELVEYLSNTEDSFKDIDISEDDLYMALGFINEKILYIEDLQEVFNMNNSKYRFKNISKYLDMLTVETNINNTFDDFSNKISLTLDLLYSTRTNMNMILKYKLS